MKDFYPTIVMTQFDSLVNNIKQQAKKEFNCNSIEEAKPHIITRATTLINDNVKMLLKDKL